MHWFWIERYRIDLEIFRLIYVCRNWYLFAPSLIFTSNRSAPCLWHIQNIVFSDVDLSWPWCYTIPRLHNWCVQTKMKFQRVFVWIIIFRHCQIHKKNRDNYRRHNIWIPQCHAVLSIRFVYNIMCFDRRLRKQRYVQAYIRVSLLVD